MGKLKKPTCTSLVLLALRNRDDFMNHRMLMKETGCSINQITATLHNLRQHRAVDCVINPDGKAWWFACPPEDDNRSKHLDEIQAEIRRKRKPRLK